MMWDTGKQIISTLEIEKRFDYKYVLGSVLGIESIRTFIAQPIPRDDQERNQIAMWISD